MCAVKIIPYIDALPSDPSLLSANDNTSDVIILTPYDSSGKLDGKYDCSFTKLDMTLLSNSVGLVDFRQLNNLHVGNRVQISEDNVGVPAQLRGRSVEVLQFVGDWHVVVSAGRSRILLHKFLLCRFDALYDYIQSYISNIENYPIMLPSNDRRHSAFDNINNMRLVNCEKRLDGYNRSISDSNILICDDQDGIAKSISVGHHFIMDGLATLEHYFITNTKEISVIMDKLPEQYQQLHGKLASERVFVWNEPINPDDKETIKHVIELASKSYAEYITRTNEILCSSLKACYGGAVKTMLSGIEASMTATDDKIRRLKNEYGQAIKEREYYVQRMDLLKESGESLDRFKDEIDLMRRCGWRNIKIDKQKRLITADISGIKAVGASGESKKIKIPPLTFHYTMDDPIGSTFVCADGNPRGGLLHPHIRDQHETVCWGGFASLIDKSVKIGNIGGVFAIVVDYLASYNDGDAYHHSRNFEEA